MPPVDPSYSSSSPYDIIELVPYGEVTLPAVVIVLVVCIVLVVVRAGQGEDGALQEIALKSVQEIETSQLHGSIGRARRTSVVMVPVLFVPEGQEYDSHIENGYRC